MDPSQPDKSLEETSGADDEEARDVPWDGADATEVTKPTDGQCERLEGAEADGGYSSNSCNGGEDGMEFLDNNTSQRALDPFDANDDAQDNGLNGDVPLVDENETEENGDIEDMPENCEEGNGTAEGEDMFISKEDDTSYGNDQEQLDSVEDGNETEEPSEAANQVDGSLAKAENAGDTGDDNIPLLDQNETDEKGDGDIEDTPETCEEGNRTAEGEDTFISKEFDTSDGNGKEQEDSAENGNETDEPFEATKVDGSLAEAGNAGDTDDDNSISIKIGSISSIQTVIHEDLSKWGAKLEASGEEEEETEDSVWEDGVEKEINDLNEKEATDSDAEYDDAILKAMQESMANDKEKGEKEKSSDICENQAKEDNEVALDGIPEVAETIGFEDDELDEMDVSNPLDDIDPYVEDSEEPYDPLNGAVDDIGTDENTSGFLDKVNSGALPMVVDLPKQFQKKRSLQEDDDDYNVSDDDSDEYRPFDDEPTERKSTPKTPKSSVKGSGNEVYFKCVVCSFPFDTIGQMKIHKFADHENEERPSFLDLAEAAIMSKKNRKTGVSKGLMLQEAMKDPSVTEPKSKGLYLLGKALRAGVAKGRLMLAKPGKSGAAGYRLVSKPNRKKVLAKWMKAGSRRLVEYKDVDDMVKSKRDQAVEETSRLVRGKSGLQIIPVRGKAPDPKKFGRGKRTPQQSNRQFGGVTVVDTDESDDEIMIVSEKITPKTKMKMKQRQQRQAGVAPISGRGGRGRGRGGSVSRGRGRPANHPVVSKPGTKKAADPFEDEDDLTCRVCLSSFWYRNQVIEHLTQAHSVKDPEMFLFEKRKKV